VEFKATLLFDIKKFRHTAGLRCQEYRNDEILFSALKTLAAFANSEGGRLYVGVEDNGTILGLGFDLQLRETSSIDRWQLFLRSVITDRFRDGAILNDYVRVAVYTLSGKDVARIDVSPRAQLSFLRKNESHLLFRRQGNRSVQVQITDVEEFLAERQKRTRW
jgi:predicted HTH transcriptional regulator